MNITLDDIITYQKIDSKLCRLLPEPYDKYARNFKKWTEYAIRENPPGNCVFTCAVIKSMLTQRSEYVETAVKIVKNKSDQLQAAMLSLAGIALFEISKEKEGIELLRESLLLENCEEVRFVLAFALGGIDGFDESNRICEDILSANPENMDAKRILAKNYLSQGLTSKAKTMIDEVLFLDPKDRAARRILGDIYFEEQDNKNAILEYKKCLEFFKHKPYIYYRLSLCYYELDKIRKSKQYAKKISNETFEIERFFVKNREVITQELSKILSK